MKSTMLKTTLIVMASSLLALTAQAENVAGWDFSQYRVDGHRTINGTTTINTLSANYSDFDPTNNAGTESATYGTMYVDGSNGSSSVTTEIQPKAIDLRANLDRDTPVAGTNGFNSFSILQGEGQANKERTGLIATAAADVVFEADMTTTGQAGTGWSVSFAGKTLRDPVCVAAGSCDSDVTVSFAPACGAYGAGTVVNMDDQEDKYTVALDPGTHTQGCVRLSMATTDGHPVIDNVAVNVAAVPEPGVLLQLAAGGALLAGLVRRRNA